MKAEDRARAACRTRYAGNLFTRPAFSIEKRDANENLRLLHDHLSLDGKSGKIVTRNPEPGTRNPEPGTRNPEPGTRNPEPGTRLARRTAAIRGGHVS
jgi:hypothetical protein